MGTECKSGGLQTEFGHSTDSGDRKLAVMLPNSIRLAYSECGNPAGLPLVLLHGFTDSARSWSTLVPHLPQTYRIIAPDLRGHGESDKPDGCYTIPELAHDICLLMQALDIGRSHMVGHSLGGRVTQAIAQRWPEIIGKIILMSTSAVLRKRGGWLWNQVQMLRDPIDPESDFIAEWCSCVTYVDAGFLAEARQDCASVPARIWRSICYEQIAYDPAPLLQDISAPTLVLRGEEDLIATAEHQSHLAGGIKGAECVSIPGHGHNLHWEAPERVARLIGRFFE